MMIRLYNYYKLLIAFCVHLLVASKWPPTFGLMCTLQSALLLSHCDISALHFLCNHLSIAIGLSEIPAGDSPQILG